MIQESFAKAKPAVFDIVERFYENLWDDHPETKALFKTTDMPAQKKALARALTFVVDHLQDDDKLSTYLKSMGSRHVNYGIREDHYEWIGQALLKTLGEAFGRLWTAELAENWAEAYRTIVILIKDGARLRLEAQPVATVIPIHGDDLNQSVILPNNIKLQIRHAVRAAVKEAIQREIQTAIEDEISGLTNSGITELLRRQG